MGHRVLTFRVSSTLRFLTFSAVSSRIYCQSSLRLFPTLHHVVICSSKKQPHTEENGSTNQSTLFIAQELAD
ncbi:hypothetical protein BDV36DRAFT_247784 [Aspergillus pseudocaelatus]|uniref:Secreted protein n=1 Tax=Aspergillus pseudocaelatus TaxID=1825620 RepID=A0ABQ6WW74_9EURO|nr:hypothetical protein BDV36DRAFT_247784 [Aspergillus pseudocaelatus]